MKAMRLFAQFAVVFAGTCITSIPAWATGGVSCEAEDSRVSFAFSADVPHGVDTTLIGPHATLKLKDKDLPDDLRDLDLSQHLIHHWLHDGPKLEFVFERESGKAYASVELVVDTKSTGNTPTNKGHYAATVHIMDAAPKAGVGRHVQLKGVVTCEVE